MSAPPGSNVASLCGGGGALCGGPGQGEAAGRASALGSTRLVGGGQGPGRWGAPGPMPTQELGFVHRMPATEKIRRELRCSPYPCPCFQEAAGHTDRTRPHQDARTGQGLAVAHKPSTEFHATQQSPS